ncbi:MAG: DUF924 family protein [Steroidobacteraceae bacterium]
MADRAREVREFWLGRLPLAGSRLEERMRFWFGGPGEPAAARHERDQAIAARFETLVAEAAAGKLDSWAGSPRRRLSLILLLDQFPRNIYRGTPRAFATDPRALELALSGIQSGADAALQPFERLFFYMPLQHAESLEVQDEAVAAYGRLLQESPRELAPWLATSEQSALAHRSIIARFGRFPHRNGILGRLTAPQEQEYLDRDPETFGQG